MHTTGSPNFAAMRTATIKAAKELYGNCSPEVIATTNAWFSVNVGNLFVAPTNTVNINGTTYNSGTNTEIEANIINVNGATVNSGATLILDACGSVTINSGFRVNAGASFIVR